MLVPPHRTSRNLYTLPDSIVDSFICHDDIPPLTKRRNHTRDRREGLSIDDACWHTQVGSDVGLGLDVHVLGAIETGGAAGADAVSTQDLDGAFLEVGVCGEGVEIIGGEVGDGAAVGEFGFGSCWPVGGKGPLALLIDCL